MSSMTLWVLEVSNKFIPPGALFAHERPSSTLVPNTSATIYTDYLYLLTLQIIPTVLS